MGGCVWVCVCACVSECSCLTVAACATTRTSRCCNYQTCYCHCYQLRCYLMLLLLGCCCYCVWLPCLLRGCCCNALRPASGQRRRTGVTAAEGQREPQCGQYPRTRVYKRVCSSLRVTGGIGRQRSSRSSSPPLPSGEWKRGGERGDSVLRPAAAFFRFYRRGEERERERERTGHDATYAL